MLDRLIFNHLKWFNFNPDAESQTLAGKQVYTAPKEIKVTENNTNVGNPKMETANVYPGTYPVIGVGEGYYLIKASGRQAYGNFTNEPCMIAKTGCIPIWGG